MPSIVCSLLFNYFHKKAYPGNLYQKFTRNYAIQLKSNAQLRPFLVYLGKTLLVYLKGEFLKNILKFFLFLLKFN
jgi:hypothetical protein